MQGESLAAVVELIGTTIVKELCPIRKGPREGFPERNDEWDFAPDRPNLLTARARRVLGHQPD